MNKSQGFHATGSKTDKQDTQTQRNQISLSSEQFLTDLNVFEFMPETGTYHFIFRFVKKSSIQLSQDEIPERMPFMDNREKDTLCSFHFSHHIH